MAESSEREEGKSSPAPCSGQSNTRAWSRLFSLAIFVYLVAWAVGFAFITRVFGFDCGLILSLIPACPLLVGARMRHRWPAARRREFAFLALLLLIASGGVVGVVQKWYEIGMDDRNAEDLMWAGFDRALRKDPSFRDIVVHTTEPKHIYWVSGTVASEADLGRLNSLAIRNGITRRLDGPLASDVSIIVK